MNRRMEAYIERVTELLEADEATKKRLAGDLRAHMRDAAGDAADDDATDREAEAVLDRFGAPEELAEELTEMLYADKRAVVRDLMAARAELRRSLRYEYRSRRTLLGVPLVHIHLSRETRWGWRTHMRQRPRAAVANGIIAVGDISIGIVSIGGVALGGICFGGVAAGLISFAGIALGLLLGLGGAAFGAFAVGGLAVGLYAFGGCALAAHVAIGGFAHGTVAIAGNAVGGNAVGAHAIALGKDSLNYGDIPRDTARALILAAYPNLWPPLLNLLLLPFA